MKRILCASIVLIMLLTGCSAPAQQVPPSTEPSENYTYVVYELNFDVKTLGLALWIDLAVIGLNAGVFADALRDYLLLRGQI